MPNNEESNVDFLKEKTISLSQKKLKKKALAVTACLVSNSKLKSSSQFSTHTPPFYSLTPHFNFSSQPNQYNKSTKQNTT
jgi:hypothetical protein